MRDIVSYFGNHDQKQQCHHDDGASVVEEILLHLIQNSKDDIEGSSSKQIKQKSYVSQTALLVVKMDYLHVARL